MVEMSTVSGIYCGEGKLSIEKTTRLKSASGSSNNSLFFVQLKKRMLESVHFCVQDDILVISIAKLAVWPVKKVHCDIDRKESTARTLRYRYAPI